MTRPKKREKFVTVGDGTRIFAEIHGPLRSTSVPVACLPGLTRNGRDFAPVVSAFAASRTVVTIDFRGRGRSDHSDPLTYRPDVELADTVAVLDDLGIPRAAVLGTSRGGIVGLLMASQHPERLAGLMLNDIGPKIESAGLLRIMAYVGVGVSYFDWDSAARSFSQVAPGFKNVPHDQWLVAVKRAYAESGGEIRPQYDRHLAATLPDPAAVKSDSLPDLWPLVPKLADVPVAILRGARSDLLSAETVARLQDELPQAIAVTVADRGHVPFLDEPESTAALRQWLASVDANEKGRKNPARSQHSH